MHHKGYININSFIKTKQWIFSFMLGLTKWMNKNTHLYHCNMAPVIAIPPGTWKDMRPRKFMRSPVSGWKAESTRCFACQSSSIDSLDALPCLWYYKRRTSGNQILFWVIYYREGCFWKKGKDDAHVCQVFIIKWNVYRHTLYMYMY